MKRAPKDTPTAPAPIRCAYADPPFIGRAGLYHRPDTPEFHPDAMRWDDPAEHVALMAKLEADFPDGWAMSCATDSLRLLLPASPPGTRVGCWARASTGQLGRWRVAFTWEALLYRTDAGINLRNGRPAALDWTVAGVGHNSDVAGFIGAKPAKFCRWVFCLLGLGGHPEDVLVDVFPGSGAVTRAWCDYQAREVERRGTTQGVLFGGGP